MAGSTGESSDTTGSSRQSQQVKKVAIGGEDTQRKRTHTPAADTPRKRPSAKQMGAGVKVGGLGLRSLCFKVRDGDRAPWLKEQKSQFAV